MLRFRILAAALLSAAVLLPGAGAEAARKPLPEWSISGVYDEHLPTGFANLAASYKVRDPASNILGTLTLGYDPQVQVIGSGVYGFTFYSVKGTWQVGEDGVQRIQFNDSPKTPSFTFDGAMDAQGRDVTGAAVLSNGFGGSTGVQNVQLRLERNDLGTKLDNFRLRFTSVMDKKGRVRGVRGPDRKETRATLAVYGGQLLEGGRIRGRVVTKKLDGTTSAKLKIVGKGWFVKMDGPVDESGFHALVDIKAAGFVLVDRPYDLPVEPGPAPPPPPPPPPPKNLLTGATATVVGSHVTITRSNVPKKFGFGKRSSLTVEFETSDADSGANPDLSVDASPATSQGAAARRVIVTSGNRTYGTANSTVTLSGLRRYQEDSTQKFEVLCTGTVSDGNGHSKSVNVLIRAPVTQ